MRVKHRFGWENVIPLFQVDLIQGVKITPPLGRNGKHEEKKKTGDLVAYDAP
ncbi:hypothetical protein [Sulfobacillus thermosulfidooxidans]|uniref:hypothetical protein n=1 Tax=Sulfobacillus thermosulfidooxidans TaxID=28034 RepID=UPI000ADD52DF|nr:hypothetical protein [Sulfobacillus thermosulfidooxidans]